MLNQLKRTTMSLIATRMLALRKRNPEFYKNEHRLSEYGALDFFYTQSLENPILTRETKEEVRRSIGRTVQLPVLNYDGTIQVSNVRTCAVPDAENTSALYDVTFVTYFIGFTVVPAMYMNNEIDYFEDFDAKIKKAARALGTALDNAAIAKLEASKSQVITDALIYEVTGDAVQVPWASREDILSDLEPIMSGDDFTGTIHVVGNQGVNSLLRKLAEKSTYNVVDKGIEWMNKRFHFSNRLANEDGKYATFYAVEEGNVDMLFRFDREAVRGATGMGHEWYVDIMPYLNIPIGIHFYQSVGDQSAIAGEATADLTCALKEYWGFSVDVAFITSYNSNPAERANPIIKGEIARGNTYAQPVEVVNGETNPVLTQTV